MLDIPKTFGAVYRTILLKFFCNNKDNDERHLINITFDTKLAIQYGNEDSKFFKMTSHRKTV